MPNILRLARPLPAIAVLLLAWGAQAQSFRVQCPAGTKAHPANVSADPTVAVADRALYSTYTQWGRADGLLNPTPAMANPGIKCQQLSGGDGFATMADGTQTYLFAFGPLSGLKNIVNGLPGTVTAKEFLQSNLDSITGNVLDVVKIGAPDGAAYPFNGAIGLVPDAQAAIAAVVCQHAAQDMLVAFQDALRECGTPVQDHKAPGAQHLVRAVDGDAADRFSLWMPQAEHDLARRTPRRRPLRTS